MKRNRILALVLTLIMAIGILPMTVSAQSTTQPIRIFVDGQQVTIRGTQPVIQAGRTLVGARDVFEHLGFTVTWNGDRREARMHRADFTIYMWIGSASFDVVNNSGGRDFGGTLDVPAQIINNSTMIPLRFPLEAVGYTMRWDGSNQAVHIYTDGRDVGTPIPTPTPTPQPTPTPAPAIRGYGTNAHRTLQELTTAEFERAVFDYVNLWRIELGLHPYVWNDTLMTASRVHSTSMHEHNYLAHNSQFTGTPTDRARNAGFNVTRYGVGEVASMHGMTPGEVVRDFYNSPSHNFFITQAFPSGTMIGVGTVLDRQVRSSHAYYFHYTTVKIGSVR